MTGDDRTLDPPGAAPSPPESQAAPTAVSRPAAPAPRPVAPAERVAAVDVLRGAALLGILAMNVVAFGWPFIGYEDPAFSGGDGPADRLAWLVNSLLFDGKMMTLFSMLFGAGLVLMAGRAAARRASLLGVYYRRLFWLLVIGLVHAFLIWHGDILVLYALCGVLLYPLRRLWPGVLLALGVGLVVFGTLVTLSVTLFAGYAERVAAQVEAARAAGRTPDGWQLGVSQAWQEGLKEFFRPNPQEFAAEVRVYREGSYWRIVRHRAPQVLEQLFGMLLLMAWGVGGRMLLGMGAMKLGVFAAGRSWRFYRRLALLGYGLGLPLTACGTLELFRHDYRPVGAPWGELLFELGMVPVALGHAAVVLLVCKAGALGWLTRRLAAVGRMALTNYLAQSLLCTTLFYGYGLGLFGRVNRAGLWGVVLGVWALQLLYSPVWLRFFRYGPAEWLWRTLTYWRWQPLSGAIITGLESPATPTRLSEGSDVRPASDPD